MWCSTLCKPVPPLPLSTVWSTMPRGHVTFVTRTYRNTTFGTGFLLYPKGFVDNGLFTGLLIMVALVSLVALSLHMLNVAVMRSPGSLTAYPETVAYFTRPWLAQLCAITITIYLIGACSSYLALVADQASALGVPLSRGAVLTLPLIAAAPFTLLRDMNSFSFTSAVGVFVNAFVVVVLCYEAADKLMQESAALPCLASAALVRARSHARPAATSPHPPRLSLYG